MGEFGSHADNNITDACQALQNLAERPGSPCRSCRLWLRLHPQALSLAFGFSQPWLGPVVLGSSSSKALAERGTSLSMPWARLDTPSSGLILTATSFLGYCCPGPKSTSPCHHCTTLKDALPACDLCPGIGEAEALNGRCTRAPPSAVGVAEMPLVSFQVFDLSLTSFVDLQMRCREGMRLGESTL